MRLVAGVLSVVLFAPFARAEDTATPPPAPAPPASPASPAPPASLDGARTRVPFRVVRVMPETRQALLFDRSRNTHVLAEVGGKLDGYTIEDIDDETVSLRRDNQQVVLVAPLHGAGRARELPPVRLRSAAAAPVSDGAPVPIDPYGDPPRPADGLAAQPPAPAPADALPPEPGIRVAHAPGTAAPRASAPLIVPGEGGIRVAVAPDVGPGPELSAGPTAPGPAPGIAPSSAAPAAGPGAIRVVSAANGAAPPAPSTPPGAPSAAPAVPGAAPAAPSAVPTAPMASSAVPTAPSAAPMAPSAAPMASSAVPTAPSAAPMASSAVPTAPSASAAARGAGEPDRPSREIAEPITTAPRAPAAARTAAIEPADPKPAEIREVRAADAARAPDKQTADARAMADILTADHPARSPRGPAELPSPTHAAEVRSAAVAPPASATGDAIAISRSDLASALADFARLTAGVHGSFSAAGVVIDSVGGGTIFQRAGLRAGDVITSVDGVRLRTLDDAANLYARASTARAITAQVVRAGKPVTLHVVIP